jgi:hypothetical protein
MKNSEKTRVSIEQLMRACQEMGHGFEMMLQKPEMTPDDWGQAVAALSETLAVARVQWAEAVADCAEQAGGAEYHVQLLDCAGEAFAGAVFEAADDATAEDSARELAIDGHWCPPPARIRLRNKRSGLEWTIQGPE